MTMSALARARGIGRALSSLAHNGVLFLDEPPGIQTVGTGSNTPAARRRKSTTMTRRATTSTPFRGGLPPVAPEEKS